MIVTTDDVVHVLIHKVPVEVTLTRYGNEVSPRSLAKPPRVSKFDFVKNVELFGLERLGTIMDLIQKQTVRTVRVNENMGSYAWKHYIERKSGPGLYSYLSNGEFIMSAYLLNRRVFWPKERPAAYGVNAYLNLEPILD